MHCCYWVAKENRSREGEQVDKPEVLCVSDPWLLTGRWAGTDLSNAET